MFTGKIHRLVVSFAVACVGLVGLSMSGAHADTLPGNTPSTPFPAAVYGNGCSVPGPNVLLDVQIIPDPFAFPHVFPVVFRSACDMHDAGYDGGIVFDPSTGATVNTTGMSRLTIDNMFLMDLTTRCTQQVPWYAFIARQQCYGIANIYFSAVRTFASSFFDASPSIPGKQSFGTRPNN
jgi:hypothetical protein